MLSARTACTRQRLEAAAVLAAVMLGFLSLATAQAATIGDTGESDIHVGAATDFAVPTEASCITDFAVFATATGGGFGGFEPLLPRTDHHVYPDANGNCPNGYAKVSVYECHYDDNYVVTCAWVDRCYQQHSG